MCRNIKALFNFEPAATEEEIRDAAIQFVRKLSGSSKTSQANQSAFDRAVNDISASATQLLESLVTSAAQKIVKKRQRKPERETLAASPQHLLDAVN